MRMLKNMLQERRAESRKQPIDFFDYVLEELKKEGTILTEGIALDLMFVLLFASFETTSLAITLAMKFLTDHPLVLKQLTVQKKKKKFQTMLVIDFNISKHVKIFFLVTGRARDDFKAKGKFRFGTHLERVQINEIHVSGESHTSTFNS